MANNNVPPINNNILQNQLQPNPVVNTQQTATQHSDIMAISLSSRIPEFWIDQPRVWFIRTEAILAPQRLGDDAKFDIVVSKLSKDVITQLTDFLSKPPDNGKFQAIKTKLLTMFEDSANRKIEKLIREMELGDQKPSQLLRRMRDLATDRIPDDTLRVLWQGHLPPNVRGVLTVTDTFDLEKLSIIADNVIEATRTNQIAEVSQGQRSTHLATHPTIHPTTQPTPQSAFQPALQPVQQSPSDTALIIAEIAKLNVRLMDLERGRPRRRSFSSGRRSRSSSRHHPRSDKPNFLCTYHYRYRENARNCRQPCAWKPKTNSEN